MSVPMPELFAACAAELDRRMRPVHYTELTSAAVASLGFAPSAADFRCVEDVREKLPLRRDLGVRYLPRPHCLMLREKWFATRQLDLINADTESVMIAGNLWWAIQGALEGWQREEHMLRKVRASSDARRMAGLFRGYTIETHAKEWFREQWPDFYRPADNEGDLTRPCGHDFKMVVDGRVWRIDVHGPDGRGEWTRPRNKPQADRHFQIEIAPGGTGLVWRGVSSIVGASPAEAASPLRMAVWLNCMRDGLPYKEIARRVAEATSRAA